MPRPHQQHHGAVAVVGADHGAAHLDHGGPQHIELGDLEFGCCVETSGGNGTGRRQHAVAADELPPELSSRTSRWSQDSSKRSASLPVSKPGLVSVSVYPGSEVNTR